MPKPKTKSKRTKQGHLPDMEPPSIPELDAAAEAYREKRDERMHFGVLEKEAHDVLLAAMNKHKLVYYEYDDGTTVMLLTRNKVRVKKKKEADDELPDADDNE